MTQSLAWTSAPGITTEIQQPNLICLIDATRQNAAYEPGVIIRLALSVSAISLVDVQCQDIQSADIVRKVVLF